MGSQIHWLVLSAIIKFAWKEIIIGTLMMDWRQEYQLWGCWRNPVQNTLACLRSPVKGNVGKSAGLDQAQRNTDKRMSAEPTGENEKEEPTERWKESRQGRLRGEGERVSGRVWPTGVNAAWRWSKTAFESVSDLGYNGSPVTLARMASVE